ncbi:MAG: NAD-dependent epimerase/dehydratase family protein [Pirellulaceae bacterium]
MTRVLVTGANGFLGFNLVNRLLEHGYQVRALVRGNNEALKSLGVEVVFGDLRNAETARMACKDMETVFHVAAVSGIWGTWKHYHSANTIATRLVVEACRERGVRKMVYTSSPSVTFDGSHQINVDESAPYAKKFLCHYPQSKALAERFVLDSNDEATLMTCALRPHLIWGPRDHHLIPRLIDRAKQNKLMRVGDGTNLVDNIYVDNAAVAHIQAAEAMRPGSPVCGSAYFLSQDEPVSCWDWINDILKLAGLPRIRKSISYRWAYRLGFMLETYHETFNISREPRMTRFLAAQLAKSHYFDISRAKRDFGYYPAVSIDEGMKRLESSLKA